MNTTKNERIVQLGSILVVLCAFASQAIPVLRIVLFLLLASLQVFLFVRADLFSGQEKGSARWKTYRFLIYVCFGFTMVLFALLLNHPPTYDMFSILCFLMIVIFGNYAPKLPHNRTLGLRLPWTIQHETTWRYAHRLLGYISVPCALVYLLGLLLDIPELCLMSLLAWFLIPSIASYRYDEKERFSMKKIYRNTPQKWLYLVFVVMILVTLCFLPFLPDDLPMQFSSDGNVNWTMPKYLGVWGIPAIAALLSAYYIKANTFDYNKLLMILLLLIINLGFLGFIVFFA